MTETLSRIIRTAAVAALAAVVCVCADRRHGRNAAPQTVIETKVDTLYLRDTITAYKPVPFNVYVVDTLYIPVEVPGQHDTVWAALPWEEKEYRDTSYRAVVEGFRPALKEIEVYQRTQVVTVTERVKVEPSRWSWGVQTGVGWNPGGGVSPYVGVGIQYRLGDLQIR